MKFRVFYSDGRPGTSETTIEATDHRTAAHQFFSQHPVSTDRRISVETQGWRDYSMQQFRASEFMEDATRASFAAPPPTATSISPAPPMPGLAVAFRVLAALEFIGGFICFAAFFSEEASPHFFSFAFLMAGIIFGCLFLAVAEGLTYLRQIRDSLAQKT